MENNYDSIVIGSGIGGLSCALSLAILKHRVLLIEQYDKIGGYLNPFSYTYGNKEYLWDYGFQYGGRMTKGNIEYDLLNYLTDGSMTFPRFDKKFQLFKCFDFPGVRDFEYNTDDNTVKPGEKYGDFTKMLLREYPEEQEAIKTFWSYLNKIQKHLEDLVKPKIFCYFL